MWRTFESCASNKMRSRKESERRHRSWRLQYPQPLDLAGAQRVMDPGTVLLAYSIGKEKSYLFVVQPRQKNGLAVFALPSGEEPLRESVEAFRNLIDWKMPPGQGPPPDLLVRSRALYDTLIKPAETPIAKHDRLLILPDGPLHTLPWAALVRGLEAGQPRVSRREETARYGNLRDRLRRAEEGSAVAASPSRRSRSPRSGTRTTRRRRQKRLP